MDQETKKRRLECLLLRLLWRCAVSRWKSSTKSTTPFFCSAKTKAILLYTALFQLSLFPSNSKPMFCFRMFQVKKIWKGFRICFGFGILHCVPKSNMLLTNIRIFSFLKPESKSVFPRIICINAANTNFQWRHPGTSFFVTCSSVLPKQNRVCFIAALVLQRLVRRCLVPQGSFPN